MPFGILGDSGKERGLVGRAATGGLAVALPAPVHFVELDHPAEAPLGIPFEHRLQELVLLHPGGRVGDPKMALKLKGRDAVFLLGQQLQGE